MVPSLRPFFSSPGYWWSKNIGSRGAKEREELESAGMDQLITAATSHYILVFSLPSLQHEISSTLRYS